MIVRNKYTHEDFIKLPETSLTEAEDILMKSRRAFDVMKNMPSYERYEKLHAASKLIEKNIDDFAKTISIEAGKPLKYARGEVKRAAFTLLTSGEEAKRIYGETIPMDVEPRGVNRLAYYNRVPMGPILAITPFNDPLNLVAHKVGPALASGNTIINKPASLTPQSAIMLRETIIEAGFPENALQTVISAGNGEVISYFLNSDEIKMITFTGGPDAANQIIKGSGIKKYSMELGNNSPVIVWNDADIDRAAELVVDAAFEAQGQNCIHAQRILVKDEIYEYFKNRVLELTSNLKIGDPLSPDTDIGPMISEEDAVRVESLIEQALEGGASILTGGEREGSVVNPTVLENVDIDSHVWKDEIFGPVTMLRSVGSMEEAIRLANDVPYGLQAGIFTSNMDMALQAIERLDFGAVLVNDTSDFRVDTMPFGGMKMSGLGREGIRFSIEEMTEIKLAVFKR